MAKKMVCLHEGCEKFGLMQPETAFYASNNPLLKRYPVCKKCIDKNVDLSKLSEILGILQQLDYPYLPKVWTQVSEQYPDIQLARYLAELKGNVNTRKMRFSESEKINEDKSGLVDIDIITDEMVELFGEGYSPKQLRAMDKKYKFLKQDYDEITSMHTESLLTVVRFKIMEEECTSKGDVEGAKKWSSMASTASLQAGITPNQMKKADLIGGITTFGELTQVIEQNADGVIPLMPQFKTRPLDCIDFNILCYIQFARHLEGKDLCTYEDVYKFYDDRKAEYIAKTGDPYNIFKHDRTEINRERVKEFIKMPTETSGGDIDVE